MTDPNRPNDDTVKRRRPASRWFQSPTSCPTIPSRDRWRRWPRRPPKRSDKMLRTLAEMENLRKRTSREVADARTYGITGFARDILEIADNLQRALDAVPAETKAAADPGLKALIEGVELTERSLLNTLEKNGVKKFDPSGEKFDPNFQQAMYEVPDPSVPVGHGGAGGAGRLHDRRSRAAPGAGRRLQGRRQGWPPRRPTATNQTAPPRGRSVLIESEPKPWILVLTVFLHVNRHPLRSKTP